MSTTPTPLLSRRGGPVAGKWLSIAAGGALACALAPLLPLLSITRWSSVFLEGPMVAIFLASAALWAARRRPARRQRRLAWLAIAVVCGWVCLFVAFALALRFG